MNKHVKNTLIKINKTLDLIGKISVINDKLADKPITRVRNKLIRSRSACKANLTRIA